MAPRSLAPLPRLSLRSLGALPRLLLRLDRPGLLSDLHTGI